MGPGVIVIYAPLCSFHLALSADAKHIVFLVYSLAVENTSEASFVWDRGYCDEVGSYHNARIDLSWRKCMM
jgi:hypothetical protein